LKPNEPIHERVSSCPLNSSIIKEIFVNKKITSVSVLPGEIGMDDGADLRLYLDDNTVVKIFATGWSREGLLIDQINM